MPTYGIDPDGNVAFLAIGAVLLKGALIGAGINAAAYTASVAFSNGGFSNWNWGQFGSAVGRGALSGAATAGIGQAFGSVGSIGKELGRASAHALSSGGISRLGGGDFWSGAAAGGLGSATGSATHNFKPHWQIAGSALSGGLGAELGGGDFLQGAAMGGIIAAINHSQDRELSDEQLAKLKAKIESDGELTLREAKKWWKLGKGGVLVSNCVINIYYLFLWEG